MVEMRGIDVLFALLRRENHTELLPQLLQLKTVHRTVFFTPQPKGSLPALAPKEKGPDGPFSFGGDGGNRTRVRAALHKTFYERIQSIEIPPGVSRLTGLHRR